MCIYMCVCLCLNKGMYWKDSGEFGDIKNDRKVRFWEE